MEAVEAPLNVILVVVPLVSIVVAGSVTFYILSIVATSWVLIKCFSF